jgi:hypothetical protein
MAYEMGGNVTTERIKDTLSDISIHDRERISRQLN